MPRLLALITLLLAAAPAAAQTGGTEAQEPLAEPAGRVVTVSDGRFTLAARSDAVLGRPLRFRGSVPPEEAGRSITIERFHAADGRWQPEATTTVRDDGRFAARWRTDRSGRLRLRATLETADARAAAATPELRLTIYRPATATWYGPGFYGRTTACGLTMTRTLVGVAHRKLPCGTKVAILYRGRAMTVPVVDRGPFRKNTRWDLTYAAASALGFTHTDRLGAVRLREPAPQPSR